MDRAWYAGYGHLVGLADYIGRTLWLAHLDGPLHKRAKHRNLVDLLSRVSEHVFHHGSARDHEHRALGVHGVSNPSDKIRGTGPVRCHADPRSASCPREAVGHEGGGLLVANGEKVKALAAVHPVEDLDHTRAHQPEDLSHSKLRKRFGNCVPR